MAPQLVGSEKQVAWAEKIRAEKIAAAQEVMDRSKTADGQSEKTKQRILEDGLALIAALENETSAAWFIDNRWRNQLQLKQLLKIGRN